MILEFMKMSEMSEDIRIKRKVVLIGDPMVGKTSLIRKYVFDAFSDEYITTLGTKISRKNLDFSVPGNGRKIELTLMIWDIMGQKSTKLSPESAFYGTKGALITCDLTRRETLDKLSMYVNELKKIVFNIPLIFIGNKSDLSTNRQIKPEEIEKLSKKFNSHFYLTSAKSGENVEDVFADIGKIMLKKQGLVV
jgi:small GTP-binding protein